MEAIWPGSSSFSESYAAGNSPTPWGLYDTDNEFTASADKFANWSAKRLGYPIMAIELQDTQFWTCFEESVTEYSAQVNQFNIRENLLSLRGQATGSNVTHKRVTPNFADAIRVSEQYGTEAGVGGTVDFKSGSIDIASGSQVYDLNALWANVSESGAIEVRKVFYEATPAIHRYFDPYAGTGAGSYNMLDGFGWGNMTPAVQFMMMPIYADLLRVQAIEFNDQIRKSAHTFELRNNKLRIFPNPTSNYKLWFEYIVKSDRDNPLQTRFGETADTLVSDYSNVPYDNMQYQYINDVGKQWVRKYGLALSKELLGMVRSKYGSIPVPNAETTLDGDTLRGEATTEKEALVTELRENLEASSRKMMLEADSDESTRLQEKLQKVPLPIYIG
jgi:hypothetical protein